MSKSSFAKNSFILTLSNLTASILVFIFSISLSKQLGPEGMGLYGLIRPLFMVFTTLVCGGLVTAVSRISSEYYGNRDYKNLKKTIKTSLLFTLLWATFISMILFLFSSILGTYLIRDTRTINSLRLLCPAIVLIALSNCLKGYFYGTFNVSIPAFIDIFEKVIRIIMLIIIINNIKVLNVTSTVTGAYFTLCIGELISFLLLYGYYKFNTKKIPSSVTKVEGSAQLLFNILSVSFPLLVSNLASSILSTVSTLVIPMRLVSSGLDYKVALGLIGKFNGMARNIVFFPMVVIESISILLIPDLSASLSKKHHKTVDYRISKAIELSFLLGATTLIICLNIGENLGFMFYNRKDLGNYIKLIALAAPILFTNTTTYGILNGLGKQNIILRNSIAISLLKILLLYILVAIPSINIYGYVITMLLTSFISLTLNICEINKHSHLKFSLSYFIIDTLIVLFTYFILDLLKKVLPVNTFMWSNIIILLCSFFIVFFLRHIIKNKRL